MASRTARLGDPRDLFWDGCAAGEHTMRFVAEMSVPRQAEDDISLEAKPSITSAV